MYEFQHGLTLMERPIHRFKLAPKRLPLLANKPTKPVITHRDMARVERFSSLHTAFLLCAGKKVKGDFLVALPLIPCKFESTKFITTRRRSTLIVTTKDDLERL